MSQSNLGFDSGKQSLVLVFVHRFLYLVVNELAELIFTKALSVVMRTFLLKVSSSARRKGSGDPEPNLSAIWSTDHLPL